MLQKWKTPEARKEGEEAAAEFFKPSSKTGLAKHLANLENLATANVNDEGKYSACKFTSVRTRRLSFRPSCGWLSSSSAELRCD